jgi:hypothetical protein
MKKSILMHENDNLVTALDNISKGDEVTVFSKSNAVVETITAKEDIKFGHKLMNVDLEKNSDIIKYNTVVGRSFKAIKRGEHAHVHNFGSARDSMAKFTNREGREG